MGKEGYKKEITKEEMYALYGLHTLWTEHFLKAREMEKGILDILEAQEKDTTEVYGGRVSDALWDLFSAKEFLHKLQIKVVKGGKVESKGTETKGD